MFTSKSGDQSPGPTNFCPGLALIGFARTPNINFHIVDYSCMLANLLPFS